MKNVDTQVLYIIEALKVAEAPMVIKRGRNNDLTLQKDCNMDMKVEDRGSMNMELVVAGVEVEQ